MSVRTIKKDYVRTALGSFSTTASSRAKKREIEGLTIYTDVGGAGSVRFAIQVIGKDSSHVASLTPFAATELLKFLLAEVPAISLAADDEAGNLLKECQARIKGEHEDARQVVKACREFVNRPRKKPVEEEAQTASMNDKTGEITYDEVPKV